MFHLTKNQTIKKKKGKKKESNKENKQGGDQITVKEELSDKNTCMHNI